MLKITFIGAGSTVFAKNLLGDCLLEEKINNLVIYLHDIDKKRLEESRLMIETLIKNLGSDAKLFATLDRREALVGAKYVINAIQVGGYEPCTIIDFEIPKKYGLKQTIGDTLGVGGIFRALRTIPVMQDIANDMEELCPNALFINYTNPMGILTGYMQRYTNIKTVGLCHSVQDCASGLLERVEMDEYIAECRWEISGINHQAWLLKIEDKDGNDLYPEIKRRAIEILNGSRKEVENHSTDLVRLELMLKFGYYITESSEHNAEYLPWFIKNTHPELINRYNIPLDEYPRRCIEQIKGWERTKNELVGNDKLTHERTDEFASRIIAAMETGIPFRVHGNVINNGIIPNLPITTCVEVPCLVDRNGITPCYVGDLPEQAAAINRTNINVQLLTIKAAVTKKKEDVYMAAMLDPHTASVLSIDEIIAMCDELFIAHKDWLPKYN